MAWFIYSFFCLQILEVNGQNFENVQLSKANEILKNNTHLSITVKTNLLGTIPGYEILIITIVRYFLSILSCVAVKWRFTYWIGGSSGSGPHRPQRIKGCVVRGRKRFRSRGGQEKSIFCFLFLNLCPFVCMISLIQHSKSRVLYFKRVLNWCFKSIMVRFNNSNHPGSNYLMKETEVLKK